MPTPSKTLVIASRGSKLALWQARHVAGLLPRIGYRGEIKVVKTSGDMIKTAPLYDFGGKGLFAKEIETVLRAKEADLAVHSLKDLPVNCAPDLTFACMLQRHDAVDVLLFHPRHRELCASLPAVITSTDLQAMQGLVLATGSLRRRFLLLQAMPTLTVQGLRGNVDTRLQCLRRNDFDSLVLAKAGLQRLHITTPEFPTKELDRTWFVPSCAQGVIAVQTRTDCPFKPDLAQLGCLQTARQVSLERAIIKSLGGSCAMPFGCFVRENSASEYLIDAVVMSATLKQARIHLRVSQRLSLKEITQQVLAGLHADGLNVVLQELGLDGGKSN